MNDTIKNLLIWAAIVFILLGVFNSLSEHANMNNVVSYSQFMKTATERPESLQDVIIKADQISWKKDGVLHTTYIPETAPSIVDTLYKAGVDVQGAPPPSPNTFMHIFISWFPMLLLIGVWIFFMRQMQGGGRGNPLSFGRSKARLLGEDQVKVTFADVAGVDEAKEEVSELVDFLKAPQKFQRLGGKIPRGVLLVGSPGTGKTLLAKAVAGEAKVPFFTISGSDFVEMFVGVGASRVRDMFGQAKKHAPCIIFIDEIDAVGRHRGAGLGGGHDEREQTLNQLLVEMDGFEGNEGVIIMAATNRPDVLDPALLRPGRFDRQVVVPLPDIRGREYILRVHLRKVPAAENVSPGVLARGTPGFSGADLANLVNEAALFAARADKRSVGMLELEKAKDKIMMGTERRSMVMTDDERRLTAYHEAGHAIVGRLVPDHDPVYKVTIIPRGRALGVTMFLPEQDRYSHSKARIESQMTSIFGGRIAEALIFGEEHVTTGASNDIKRATELARNMVTKWGLSDVMGPLLYSDDEDEVFLGRSVTKHKEISDETAHAIDEEVRRIVDRNYQRAEKILKDNLEKLHLMSEALIKYETLDNVQLDAVMAGEAPPPPEDWEETSKTLKDIPIDDPPRNIPPKPKRKPARRKVSIQKVLDAVQEEDRPSSDTDGDVVIKMRRTRPEKKDKSSDDTADKE